MLILPGPIRLAKGQDVTWLVTTTDAALAAWAAATLSIRSDPNWPRVGAFNVTDVSGDEFQSWPLVVQATNFTRLSATTYQLTLTRAQTALIPWGHLRCALDVWRADAGNTYPDVWPTWVDVVSPVYPGP